MITGVASATAEASFPRDWIYPIDRAPCDSAHTLQQCVQGAASGDTVEIHTNTPLHQGVEIAKRLSLMSSPGYHATLDNLMIDPGSGTIQVHVSRLAVGSVLVELNGGSNHVIDLEQLTVASPGSTAVELDSSVPADITFSGSAVHVP